MFGGAQKWVDNNWHKWGIEAVDWVQASKQGIGQAWREERKSNVKSSPPHLWEDRVQMCSACT